VRRTLNARDLCKTMRADNQRPKPCFTLCSSSSCIDGFHQALRSSRFGGRPKIAAELRALIRRMSAENPYGRAARSKVSCSSSASRSLSRRCGPSCQGGAPFCLTMRPTSPPWICSCPVHWLRPPLCPRDRSTGAPKTCLYQRHTTSNRGMDCTPGQRHSLGLKPRATRSAISERARSLIGIFYTL
jgi:hypothetical protein